MSRKTAFVLAAAAGLAVAAPAYAANVWTGNGDGVSWSDPANWSDGVVPGSSGSPTDVTIGDGAASVILDFARTLAALTIGSDDELTIAEGGSITMSDALTNDGVIRLDAIASSGFPVSLTFSGGGTANIDGSGEIVMSDDAQNQIRASSGTIVHGTDHTIRGAGSLLGNFGGMINNGTVLAQGANALVIDPDSSGFVNNGVLRAEGAGGITLNAGVFTNNTTIEADDGSEVRVNSSAEIVGGTLATSGTGRIVANSGSDFTGVTVSAGSSVVLPDAQAVEVRGGLTNDGTWSIEGNATSGFNSTLTFAGGDQTLDGTGEIVMNDDAQNRILASGVTIDHGAGHTIRGAGSLLGNFGGMINNGTVLAQGANALVIDPASEGFVNNGVLRAEGAGGIALSGGEYTNNTTIEAADGSEVRVNSSAEIVGGTLATSGTGRIVANSGSDFTGVTVSAGSSVLLPDAQAVEVRGGLTNDGTWSIEGNATSGFNSTLTFAGGDQTLDGTGEIVMNDDAQNRILASGVTIDHGAGHTIRGAGSLLGNFGGMINNGTVLAQGANALVIDPASEGFVNNGVLRAEGAGGITLNAGVFTNNTTIEADDGSEVRVNSSAEIVGGTLATSGTGRIVANSGSDFTGVTVSAGSSVVLPDAQAVEVRGGLTNNGTWSIEGNAGSGFNSSLSFVDADQTLGGTGELFMNDDAQNLVRPISVTLTQGADHTIRGAGSLLGNLGGMVNNGTILAEGTNDLVIDPSSLGFINNGTIGGDGSIVFNDGLSNDGTIAPGSSIGTLDWTGDIANSSTAAFDVELGALGASDLLAIDGAFDANGIIDLSVLVAIEDVAGETFTVLTATDGVTGVFSNAVPTAGGVAIGVESNGFVFDVTYTQNSVLIGNVVPTPGAGLVVLGGLGLTAARRRRAS